MPHAAITQLPQRPKWLNEAEQLFKNYTLVKFLCVQADAEDEEDPGCVRSSEYAIFECNESQFENEFHLASGKALYAGPNKLLQLANLCANNKLDFMVGMHNGKMYTMLTSDIEMENLAEL